jgi:hypothetical protein
LLIWVALWVSERHAWSDPRFGETRSGPDSHEVPQETSSHLFGDWYGLRMRLFERVVRFDFQYIGDNLWGLKRQQQRTIDLLKQALVAPIVKVACTVVTR